MSATASAPAPIPGFAAVIPAGGVGSRLWPLSRPDRPKFLLDLLGEGRTLLQATVDRVGPLAERVVIVTGASHAEAVAGQVPEVDRGSILAEPSPRDSMAAIALAAAVLEHRHGPVVMGSFAADQVVRRAGAFQDAVREAVEVARGGKVVTIGIAPTGPSEAYGYIEAGAPLAEDSQGAASVGGASGGAASGGGESDRAASGSGESDRAASARAVSTFTEKPDALTAQRFLATGRYFWNAGMFVVRTDVLLGHLDALQPGISAGVRTIAAAWDGPEAAEVLAETWPTLTRIAIDHAIAEPVAAQGGVAVVPADLDWYDVGDFDSLAGLLDPRDDGAIVSGRTAAVGVHGSEGAVVIGGDRPVVVIGVPGAVVVDSGDSLLVTTRAAAQDVKLAASLLAD